MRWLLAALLSLSGMNLVAAGDDFFQWSGYSSLRGARASGPPSFLQDGQGRFTEGQDDAAPAAQLHLGLDWRPSVDFHAHIHIVGRAEEHETKRGEAGVPEAYAEMNLHPGSGDERLRFRAGAFFLPTSRENVDALWETPFTITPSALNTWLGLELRPIGVDGAWFGSGARSHWSAGATLFRGNDTFGSLPVKHGWLFADHVAVLGERIRADDEYGSSVTAELDHRLGVAARLRWSGERFLFQLSHIDNRSDGREHGSLLAWNTRFNIAGVQYVTESWNLGGEIGWGESRASAEEDDHDDVRLGTAYLLASRRFSAARATLRLDLLHNDDRGEERDYTDHGHALTAAAFWEPPGRVRIGIEWTSLLSARAGSPFSRTNRLVLEARYRLARY